MTEIYPQGRPLTGPDSDIKLLPVLHSDVAAADVDHRPPVNLAQPPGVQLQPGNHLREVSKELLLHPDGQPEYPALGGAAAKS